MHCVIIAAGKGERIRDKGDIKPLIPVLGKAIIERVIGSAMMAGINEFHVVTGYEGEKVRSFLNDLSGRLSIKITHIINEEWNKANGISVLKAKDYIKGNFLLLMGDHLFDSELLNDLKKQKVDEGEIALAVDTNMSNPLVDIDDVTKVMIEGNKIIDINKKLNSYNGFDTGLFHCSSAIFEAIEKSISENQDTSLSGGVRWLAKLGKVKPFKINNNFWIDVDEAATLQKAEEIILKQQNSTQND